MKNTYLDLNLPSIGQRMIKMAQKAIKIIRQESEEMIVEDKTGYDGAKWDCVTNADRKAQEMYLGEIREHFPTFGVIAEEKELTIPCTDPDVDVYFTIDPLDGTKAYARKQSHGVGTMIGLVCNDNIVAVVIGDANTGEIYSYANEADHCQVDRHRFNYIEALGPDTKRPLRHQYAFLLENPRVQPKLVREMIEHYPAEGGLFKDFEIGGGSIGLRFARLWKGEVGALFISPTYDTPWDLMPVLGISQRLGFNFFRFDEELNSYVEYEHELIRKITKRDDNILVIHNTHVAEMKNWIRNNNKRV